MYVYIYIYMTSSHTTDVTLVDIIKCVLHKFLYIDSCHTMSKKQNAGFSPPQSMEAFLKLTTSFCLKNET